MTQNFSTQQGKCEPDSTAVGDACKIEKARARAAGGRGLLNKMARAATVLGLAALWVGHARAGINLDDHFKRSARITSSNMLDDKVKTAVNSGKTLFVRIIASDG